MKELMFTPGPTEVSPHVLRAISKPLMNPDLDARFFEIYDALCDKIRIIAGTKNDLFVMSGEGMVALDSAVANLVEPKERVLAISSGVFGDGFVDLVKSYGGRPLVVKAEYNEVVAPNQVDRELEKRKDIRVATFVHCETPNGTIAPLETIGKVCNDHDITLIADTVSTLGGVPVDSDRNHVDICLGASQKCFSSPPGLAIISVSDRAWEKIERRKRRVESFYLRLMEWKKMWLGERTFPYTQSVSEIFALDRSLGLILNEGISNVYQRHSRVADYVRDSCEELGLELFPLTRDICSDTVTALKVPSGIEDAALRERMRTKYGVVISGSWGKLSGRVIRLGHMGFNAQMHKARSAINALARSLSDGGRQRPSALI
ncbi:MAG: pyridoxal-phosphate-dependent aminotransferase family protein [Nitrososphaerales archaeon]